MPDTQTLGTYSRSGDLIDVRFERRYPHAIEKVWKALTDPARLSDWMGESIVEPKVGGRFETMLGTPGVARGQVRVWDEPNVLEFSWNNWDSQDAVIRYELTRDGDSTRVVFTHSGMPYDSSALMMPGWHVLLNALGEALSGASNQGLFPDWKAMQGEYVAHYGLTDVRLGH